MRRIAILALVTAALVVSAAAALAAQSPKALRAKIVAAGLAQHSVHWVMKVKNRPPGPFFTFISDAGTDQGSQRLTLKVGSNSAHLTVELVDQTVYVKGDEAGLIDLQGLTGSQAHAYAGKWISIPKGDKDYADAADGLTISTLMHDSEPHGLLAIVRGKTNGKHFVGVSGTTGTGKRRLVTVLYAPAHGKKRPLKTVSTAPSDKKFSNSTVFSKWNETVAVTAPESSTPIATVRGG
ncbi:MAG TPA: hypothetical protein VGH79_02005 [Gaiellaceae bacterium]|jgi:hypothetical protein